MTSENAERCVAAGSGSLLRREGRGGRRATRVRRFGVRRCLDVRDCEFHRACARAGRGARARQPAPLTARMMGHGLGLAARHYAERDGLKGAALRPTGGGYTAVTDGLSSTCSAASAPTMIRCSWPATASSRPSCSAWTEPPSWLADSRLAFRQRGWEGDDELADQLEAQLGSGPAAMLRALPVDLEELAGILEGDPLSVGGRIDIRTGEVWSQAAIEYVLETGEEDEDTS